MRAVTCMLLSVLLAACGGTSSNNAPRGATTEQTALPRPASAARGSITGMPAAPGPGNVPIAGTPPSTPEQEALAAAAAFNPETPLPPGAGGIDSVGAADMTRTADPAGAAVATEPTPADAQAVLREYYGAVSSRSYARAYALWSGSGSASGQTPQQFADGFADTASAQVQPAEPSQVDAGAGQRHITVPVTVEATHRDGSQHRYIGSYVLQRSVVDGATQEQRAWRIRSADLREVMR